MMRNAAARVVVVPALAGSSAGLVGGFTIS